MEGDEGSIIGPIGKLLYLSKNIVQHGNIFRYLTEDGRCISFYLLESFIG